MESLVQLGLYETALCFLSGRKSLHFLTSSLSSLLIPCLNGHHLPCWLPGLAESLSSDSSGACTLPNSNAVFLLFFCCCCLNQWAFLGCLTQLDIFNLKISLLWPSLRSFLVVFFLILCFPFFWWFSQTTHSSLSPWPLSLQLFPLFQCTLHSLPALSHSSTPQAV